MHKVHFSIEKQPPVSNGSSENLELFHGIGNKLGFNITGGSDFNMPITIFHVKEGSRAENAGLKLGDSIVTINNVDTSNMTLQEANNVLEQAAQQDVKLGVVKFDEVDEAVPEKRLTIHEILLKGNVSVEMTIKSMQRQLLEIADRIPNDILLNLLKSFAQIVTRDPEPTPRTPFIRAFAKIRDDNAAKQFSAIIEEDEDNHVVPHEENAHLHESLDIDGDRNEQENECSFNYKVSNVVTQEVIYSMNGNELADDQQQPPQEAASAAIVDDSNDSNEDETNGDQMDDNRADNEAADENLPNGNHDEIIENGISENGSDAIDEGIEVEMPKLVESQDASTTAADDVSQEVDETCNNAENGEIMGESQKALEDEVEPLQKVTLDDIQREIQEMQMFMKHKNAQEEAAVNHEIKSSQTIEDAFKVDVCLNLNKKKKEEPHEHHHHRHHHKKHSKSKAILANYLNGAAKEYLPKPIPIFDPAVPNTPEDFMKEKCVSEKINKKKQKIKNLDVNWQKLVDSQKKVYKHSNFEAPNVKKGLVEQQKSVFN